MKYKHWTLKVAHESEHFAILALQRESGITIQKLEDILAIHELAHDNGYLIGDYIELSGIQHGFVARKLKPM